MERAPETVALLDVIIAHAPIGLGFWDHELRLRHANAALLTMARRPDDDPHGLTAPQLLGELGHALEQVLAGVLATEAPIVARSVQGATPFSDGTTLHWIGSYFPVFRDDGHLLGVAGLQRAAAEPRPSTDHRALQEALIARTEAESARARTAFIAG